MRSWHTHLLRTGTNRDHAVWVALRNATGCGTDKDPVKAQTSVGLESIQRGPFMVRCLERLMHAVVGAGAERWPLQDMAPTGRSCADKPKAFGAQHARRWQFGLQARHSRILQAWG